MLPSVATGQLRRGWRQRERASRPRSVDPEWRRGADRHAGGHFWMVTVDFGVRQVRHPEDFLATLRQRCCARRPMKASSTWSISIRWKLRPLGDCQAWATWHSPSRYVDIVGLQVSHSWTIGSKRTNEHFARRRIAGRSNQFLMRRLTLGGGLEDARDQAFAGSMILFSEVTES